MKKITVICLTSASIAIGATPALAEVDPKIHKLCIEAKDYAGCVRAMRGETIPTSRQINSQGADIAEGNACPPGYAHIGGGNCRQVECKYGKGSGMGHDPRIAGKTMPNGKDRWGCKQVFIWSGKLALTEEQTRAFNDPNCPPGQLRVGFNSTCDYSPSDWKSPGAGAASAQEKASECNSKLVDYGCSYDAYLDANPSMKEWAELNPEMADKERIKLQSID